MRAELHPEYTDELRNLEDTFTTICRKRDNLDTEPDRGADEWTSAVLRGMVVRKWNKLTTALDQPYFGRVDWIECADCLPETIYIGRQECTEANIFSWAAPLVGELYYKGTSTRSDRQRLLKRTFHLQRTTLDEIIDEFIHPRRSALLDLPDQLRDLPSEVADNLLISLLAESRDNAMRDVVRSIQEQQYRIISSPEDSILVVQGVAGSGKTAIALHRLPYLLYNDHRKKGAKRGSKKAVQKTVKASAKKTVQHDDEADKYLFLGPNNLFLNYVASVLSLLWSSNIPQQPFDTWLLELLEKPVKYQSQDESLEYLLDSSIPVAARQKHQQSEQLKGSPKMVILMDRYTEYIEREVLDRMQAGLSCVRKDPELVIQGAPEPNLRWERSIVDVQEIMRGNAGSPIMERISMAEGYFIKRATKDIEDDINAVAKHKSPRRTTPPLTDVAQAIREYFDQRRPAPAIDHYRKLLATRSLIGSLGAGILTNEEIDVLHSESAQKSRRLSFGDLAAVVYLHSKLCGAHSLRNYRHIVVDEAQDVTPMQLHVLRQYAPTASYTLVGDSAQSIFTQGRTSNWQQVTDILKPIPASPTVNKPASASALQIEQIRQSYRSTREIIEFCNKILLRVGAQEHEVAIPIARPGAVPQVVEFKADTERAEYVRQTILGETRGGSKTIAVICKSLTNCHQFLDLWQRGTSTPLPMIVNRQSTYAGGVVLLPAYLAKGLEFDVVIVADADAGTYPGQALDSRLLYVALTRAAHALYVCCTGEVSPLLGDNRCGSEDRTGVQKPKLLSRLSERIFRQRSVDAHGNQQSTTNTAQRKICENIFSSGNFYHLVQNAVDGQNIASSRSEQVAFIECLQKHFTPNPVKIVAYCLLPSCYHLLVRLQTAELDKLIMRPFVQEFSQRISHSTQPVLDSTFGYHYLPNTAEVISMTRAIHFSPVLSGVAKMPEEWIFSSYQDYIGLRKGTLPTLTYVLSSFSSPAAYGEYVNSCTTDEQKAIVDYLQKVQPYISIEYV